MHKNHSVVLLHRITEYGTPKKVKPSLTKKGREQRVVARESKGGGKVPEKVRKADIAPIQPVEQDALALLGEASQDPTLDAIMRRVPGSFDYTELVKSLRDDRARYIAAQKAKEDKATEDDD